MAFDNGIFTVDDWSPSTEALEPSAPDNYVASDTAQAGLDEIAAGLSLTLLRDGSVAFTGDADMGGNKIENLTAGTLDSDGITKLQLDTVGDAKADLDLQNVTSGAYASETVRGVSYLASDADMVSLTDATKAVTPYQAGKLLSGSNAYSLGFIRNFIPVWVDSTKLSCSGGSARDIENTININTDGTITKDISLDWEVGTGGGLADGVVLGAVSTIHMFLLAGGTSAATYGTYTTDDISGNITNFQAISDGYLTYRIDNGALDVAENLDFSSVSTVNDIANVLNAQIADAQVIAVGNTIQFSSSSTGPSSSITIFASTETGTDIYLSSYLDGDNGLSVSGDAEQSASTDYGFDTDVDATNLLLDDNVIAAGLNRYRLLASFRLDDLAEFYEFSISGINSEIEVAFADVTISDTSLTLSNAYQDVAFSKMPAFVDFKPNITYKFTGSGAGVGLVKEQSDEGSERVASIYSNSGAFVTTGYSDLSTGSVFINLKMETTSGITSLLTNFYENGYRLQR